MVDTLIITIKLNSNIWIHSLELEKRDIGPQAYLTHEQILVGQMKLEFFPFFWSIMMNKNHLKTKQYREK